MRISSVAIALTALTVPAMHAQERTRTLNGFAFMPSTLVEGPFAINWVQNATGGGVAFDLETPFISQGDTIAILVGNVGFITLDLGWQHRFGNWFAARIGLGAVGRVGINKQSALAQGMTAVGRWSVGATAQVYRSQSFALSAAVDISQSGIVGLDPIGFAESILDDGLAPTSPLLRSTSSKGGRLSARAAWAPAPWIGLTGTIDGGLTRLSSEDNQSRLGGGGTIGVDLANLASAPLGILLSAETEAFNQNGPDLTSRASGLGIGLFYTGWNAFSVGLENSWRRFKRRSDDRVFDAFLAAVNLQYFY